MAIKGIKEVRQNAVLAGATMGVGINTAKGGALDQSPNYSSMGQGMTATIHAPIHFMVDNLSSKQIVKNFSLGLGGAVAVWGIYNDGKSTFQNYKQEVLAIWSLTKV